MIKDRSGAPTVDYLHVNGENIVLTMGTVTRARHLIIDLFDHAGVS
jgi:hypothetical protein